MNWWSSRVIVFPDLGKQVSYICSTVVVTCMWVDREPENQGNIQQVCRPNVLHISQMLLYIIIVFEILTEMLMPTDTSST